MILSEENWGNLPEYKGLSPYDIPISLDWERRVALDKIGYDGYKFCELANTLVYDNQSPQSKQKLQFCVLTDRDKTGMSLDELTELYETAEKASGQVASYVFFTHMKETALKMKTQGNNEKRKNGEDQNENRVVSGVRVALETIKSFLPGKRKNSE